jgi:hypothetical protein
MPQGQSLILGNVFFIEDDYRLGKTQPRESTGFAFLCSFGAKYFLMGCQGKLWRVNSNTQYRDGYKKDWPWLCRGNRLKVETIWCPMNYHNNPFPYSPHCYIYVKRGRYYRSVYRGRFENINHLLIRLQRWTRRMLKRPKILALFMALHPRLGADSGVAELNKDILELITG